MSEIKMIISDLDGTLLGNDHLISQENLDALIAIQAKDVSLVIASGRGYQQIRDICKNLNMEQYNNGYIVGNNGLELYSFKDNSYHKLAAIDNNDIIAIRKSCFFLKPIYLSDSTVYRYQKELNKPFKLNFKNYDISLPNYQALNLNQKPSEVINKVSVKCPTPLINIFIKYLNLRFNVKYQAFKVSKNWIEIMPSKINKALRIKEIIDNNNISTNEIMVFGDFQNDIEMLSLTSNSYAMANALNEVKKCAKHVTYANYENGVAKVINEILN